MWLDSVKYPIHNPIFVLQSRWLFFLIDINAYVATSHAHKHASARSLPKLIWQMFCHHHYQLG